MVYWHHHLEMHLKNDWVEWYAQRCCEPLHAHNNLPKIFICHQNCDRRANCIHGNIGSRIIHYCRPGIFRALLFFAIFAIWTPFAKNIRSRKFPCSLFLPFYALFRVFWVFSGICRLLSSLLFAHSRKIHARENFGWPFANNSSARNISGLQ